MYKIFKIDFNLRSYEDEWQCGVGERSLMHIYRHPANLIRNKLMKSSETLRGFSEGNGIYKMGTDVMQIYCHST